MTELIISGDTISLVEKKIVHTTTIKDFEQSIVKLSPLRSEILPVGCKAFVTNPAAGVSCYVVERLPGLTSLTFHKHKHATDDLQDFLISLPFMQFYVVLKECPAGYAFVAVYLSCTKVPIRTYEDHVYIMSLPNIFNGGEGKVCTGDIRVAMSNPSTACEELISSFFSAPSNLDLSMRYPRELAKGGDNHQAALSKWAELSNGNPLFGISKDITYHSFSNHESTFGKRIDYIMREYRG